MATHTTFHHEELGSSGAYRKIRLEIAPEVSKFIPAFPAKVASDYLARKDSPDFKFFEEFYSMMRELNPKNLQFFIERDYDALGNKVYYISIQLEKTED